MKAFTKDAARSSRPLVLLPLLALLHLALWLGLGMHGRQAKPVPPDLLRTEVRLLAPRMPRLVPTPPRSKLATALPAGSQATRPRANAGPSIAAISAPEPPEITAPPAEQSKDLPAQTPSLLQSEATRRALRQATRTPLLSERAAQAMGDGPPLEQSARLGNEIQKAGNGDCLKGEFAGGGAGILSLPFWLLAEARGKCAR